MSLIARCPACGTLFRVVPDQLKISDGWVRCGQCGEVFDANQTLQQVESMAPASPAPVGPEPAPQAPADTFLESTQETGQETPRLESTQTDPPGAQPASPQGEDSEAALLTGAQTRPEADLLPEPVVQAREEPPPPENAPRAGEPLPAWEPSPAQAEPRHDTLDKQDKQDKQDTREPVLAPGPLDPDPGELQAATDSARPAQDVSFVRQARRRAFWQSRGVRLTLSVLAVAFTLSLAGQVAYHQRDRLASEVPALQPALAALCEALQCRLGPPRRIEAIAIESSAFTRLRPDAFRLQLTLTNQAGIALAVPALELTLTDLQDQPVLRRVLQAADLGPDAPAAIAPRAEWSSTLTLTVAAGVDPSRIVGYRVLAFYP